MVAFFFDADWRPAFAQFQATFGRRGHPDQQRRHRHPARPHRKKKPSWHGGYSTHLTGVGTASVLYARDDSSALRSDREYIVGQSMAGRMAVDAFVCREQVRRRYWDDAHHRARGGRSRQSANSVQSWMTQPYWRPHRPRCTAAPPDDAQPSARVGNPIGWRTRAVLRLFQAPTCTGSSRCRRWSSSPSVA